MVRAGRILLRDLPASALSVLGSAVGFYPQFIADSHWMGTYCAGLTAKSAGATQLTRLNRGVVGRRHETKPETGALMKAKLLRDAGKIPEGTAHRCSRETRPLSLGSGLNESARRKWALSFT